MVATALLSAGLSFFPYLVLGPSCAAPENVALAGTSLDGDRSFQTELESPQDLHKAKGCGSGCNSPKPLPAPGGMRLTLVALLLEST